MNNKINKKINKISKTNNNKYNAESILVLEGLDAVRKRPGMYIGSTDSYGLHHLVWEIVDNAIDEALSGYSKTIIVALEKGNVISVEDDGRGIPIGMHSSGKPTPEIIFTQLHAGGKFKEGAYKVSGGLHGVGASVVNALSSWLTVEIFRDKKAYEVNFQNGGNIKNKFRFIKNTNKRGTKVVFKPDDSIFKGLQFNSEIIRSHLQESAFLTDGIKLIFNDKIKSKTYTYQYNNGLMDFISKLNEKKTSFSPVGYFKSSQDNINVSCAFQYTKDYSETLFGFANNIKTVDGGTHISGFKNGFSRAIIEYANQYQLLKSNLKLDGSDIREGLTAIISVQIPESLIQFEGQTKSKLGSPIVKQIVEKKVQQHMLFWLQEHKSISEQIINKAVTAKLAKEAARKARNAIRKTKSNLSDKFLVGKLTPAQSKSSEKNELFLVEGASAGGSAKLGRNKKIQAILPLKGKVINAERASSSDLLKNDEILTIIHALGTNIGDKFNYKKLNYKKIIIMTDADVDGSHIQILLLTFFYRYMPELIANGNIFIACPPLFKVTLKNKQSQYLWDENDLQNFLITNDKISIQRYKGLGEMNAEQLWETTMNPTNRKLLKVTIDDPNGTEQEVVTLMGSDSAKRKSWIMQNINFKFDKNDVN